VYQGSKLEQVEGSPGAVDRSANHADRPGASQLDNRTLLVSEHGSWRARAFPAAREAILTWAPDAPDWGGASADGPRGPRERGVRATAAPDQAAAAEHRERSRRRARGRLRRYAVANRCTRLWTFTYRPPQPFERSRVVEDWHAFARALRAAGIEVPWVRVIERHQSGALHLHAGFGGFVDIRQVEVLWPHGYVHAKKMRTRRGGREDGRAAAVYLAKYAGKASVAFAGQHSYEVAQGFPVVELAIEHPSLDPILHALARRMNGPAAYEWDSGSSSEWRGPPTVYLAW
jgi:hypothetical protein